MDEGGGDSTNQIVVLPSAPSCCALLLSVMLEKNHTCRGSKVQAEATATKGRGDGRGGGKVDRGADNSDAETEVTTNVLVP